MTDGRRLRERGESAAVWACTLAFFLPGALEQGDRVAWCSYMFSTYGGFSGREYLARVASGDWGSQLLPLCAVLPPETFAFLNRR
jgi:hypothetical protein